MPTPPRSTLRSRVAHLRWWHEVLIVAVGYAAYTFIRNAMPEHEAAAQLHALRVIQVEQALHLFHERGFNLLLAAHKPLAVIADYWYATMHFIVTIGVAVWVLRRHRDYARPLRIAWYAMNLLALIGFALFPLAPPRLTGDGFVDTIVRFGTWGSWGSKGVESTSNQYAAMPSLHIGWSLWCAIVIVALARHRWAKVLGIAYPLVTLAVILGTANHYVLDAVAGAATCLLGFVVQRLFTGAWAFADPASQRGPVTPLSDGIKAIARRRADDEPLVPAG